MKPAASRIHWRRGTRRTGFTLIELLVVLAILGMLAAVAGPRVFRALGGAQTDAARVQLEALANALDMYRLELGSYPAELEHLVTRPPDATGWSGPYLRKAAIAPDPWGRAWIYASPGKHGDFDLSSFGADGEAGGEGDDADVVSWQ